VSVVAQPSDIRDRVSATAFALACAFYIAAAASLSALVPLQTTLVSVFAFAGLHNWLELRLFLGRLPARLGPQASYLGISITGSAILSGSFILIRLAALSATWPYSSMLIASRIWTCALVLWVVWLLPSHQRRAMREDPVVTGLALAGLCTLAWRNPGLINVALIYGHPLMAMFILDLELGRRRPAWRTGYRAALCLSGVILVVLWLAMGQPGESSPLGDLVVQQAASDLLAAFPSHRVVATYAFLQLLHYGAWLVAIPLVVLGERPWEINRVGLGRRAPAWRAAIGLVLVLSAAAVVLLWVGFAIDFRRAWMIYFTLSIFHVLAEIPFSMGARGARP
jgi:hypothetical protein